jgi:Mor family transcriptional regulator
MGLHENDDYKYEHTLIKRYNETDSASMRSFFTKRYRFSLKKIYKLFNKFKNYKNNNN